MCDLNSELYTVLAYQLVPSALANILCVYLLFQNTLDDFKKELSRHLKSHDQSSLHRFNDFAFFSRW